MTGHPLGVNGRNEGQTKYHCQFWLHPNKKSLGLGRQGMEKPPSPSNDLPRHQQEQQRNHHSEHPMESYNLH